MIETSNEGCRWSGLLYRRAFLRQHRFGEPRLIARTQWQYRIVEIVMGGCAAFLRARHCRCQSRYRGPGLPLEETGEIFSAHAQQQVAPDVALADKRCRGGRRNLGFGRCIGGQRIAPLGSDAATQSSRYKSTIRLMTRIALSRPRKQYRVTYIRRAAPPGNTRSASTPGRLPLIADGPAAAERSADDKMRVVTVLRSPGAPRQLTVW